MGSNASKASKKLHKHVNPEPVPKKTQVEVRKRKRKHCRDIFRVESITTGPKASEVSQERQKRAKTVHLDKPLPVPKKTQAQGKETKKFKCQTCGHEFISVKELIKHTHPKRKSPEKTDYLTREAVCQLCGFRSSKVREVARHVNVPCARDN